MTKTRHTKAPWTTRKGHRYTIYDNAGNSVIATVSPLLGEEEAEANVSLLKAAPRLLEALESYVQWHHRSWPKGEADNNPLFTEALAAIKDAKEFRSRDEDIRTIISRFREEGAEALRTPGVHGRRRDDL